MKNKLTKERIEDIKTKIVDFTFINGIYDHGIYKIEIVDNSIIIYSVRPGVLVGVECNTIFKLRNYLGADNNFLIMLREPNRNDIIKATNKELGIKEKELVDCYPTVLETLNKINKIESRVNKTIKFVTIYILLLVIVFVILLLI